MLSHNRFGGAAQNAVDIPIPDKYKFDERVAHREDIIKQIKKCLNDYNNCILDFERYRKVIRDEKQKFEADAMRFMEVINDEV